MHSPLNPPTSAALRVLSPAFVKRRSRTVWLALAAGILGTCPFAPDAFAQSLASLAGTWNDIMFSAPSRLTLYRDWVQVPGFAGAYLLRDIGEKNYFDMSTGQITVGADGTFTGIATGTVSIASGGRMVASVPSNAPVTFQMNAAADFMFAMKQPTNANVQDIELLLKAPATMTGAEMAGTWNSVSFDTPAQLALQRETSYNTYATNVVGGEQFRIATGSVTLNADGTLVVNESTGPMPGTYSQVGLGAVDVTLMGGAFTLHFFVNASKNIMACINPTDPESHELILLVKPPASAAPSDFKGLWRGGSYVTPSTLTLIRTNFGLVTDIAERNGFEFSIGPVNMGHSGVFTSPSEPAVGLATLVGAGTVQTVATNTFGEVSSDTFWANAGKDVMVTVTRDGGNRLTLAARAPAESVRTESLGMMLVGATVYWASDTNRSLQVSTNMSDWNSLVGTAGQGSYLMNQTGAATNANAFFRVVATP
jgi:hypothetical protein